MEDSRASTSSQSLARTFGTLIESPEADIASIPVVRSEHFSTSRSRNIQVSVQELAYGVKIAGVGASAKPLDRDNELFSSSEEVLGPRKHRGPFEGMDFNILQRDSPTDKIFIEKPKHIVTGSEEEVGSKEGKKPCGSSSSLHKCQTQESKPQRTTRRARKRKSPNGTSLTLRITELQRENRQP
ncbi:hypothetical protein O181_118193 [Austropuccinia psidii MF-1]|uniref:Uncharacterized protein n=1 Tax=Austropuccinia psidii MF-1 TaxID=1389203 RepID=A0A9Q3PY73_9BASI|nr:hypothetical protein [Austropuccinia psidii MF-1]